MNRQPVSRWQIGLIGLGVVLLWAVIYSVPGWIDQINRVQKFRTDFAMRCANNRGQIIEIGKGNVSRVCVGPDGRWLEWY